MPMLATYILMETPSSSQERASTVQQGDPLGPFLFSLGIADLTKNCSSEFSGWYLDDGTLAGNPDTIQADFQ